MKKAALHNLGCKVNAYETQAMQELLEQAGYRIVPFSQPADVYVINTCSVTNIADRKSRQMLHRARRQNPQAIVVATGCYVQTMPQEEMDDLGVDVILGNNHKNELVATIARAMEQSGRTYKNIAPQSGHLCFEEMLLTKTAGHTRAFLKVQDGCNQFCSYCIIPYARGRVRSRDPHAVIAEVRGLLSQGFLEIVLTGIHLSSYGVDIGTDLISLIEAVHQLPGLLRIRLGSLEPMVVTPDFVNRLSRLPKVCPHFHLSLQSGCDATLQRMNRKYTKAEFESVCDLLRKAYDAPALTTDIIVGFPQETEEEFEETCAFAERIGFSDMHVFKYSRREGTPAARMKGQVSEQVKARRSKKLIGIADGRKLAYRERLIGHTVSVLFEEPLLVDGVPCYVGVTPEYVRVAAPADTDMSNRQREVIIGRVCRVGGETVCVGAISDREEK